MIKRMLLAVALVLAVVVSAGAGSDSPMVGTWEGTLAAGMGGQLRVVLNVTQTADGLAATMDSPDQNSSNIPVKKVALDAAQKLTLDVEAVRGSYEGTLDAKKGEVSGTWSQSGQQLPLVFKKQPAKK